MFKKILYVFISIFVLVGAVFLYAVVDFCYKQPITVVLTCANGSGPFPSWMCLRGIYLMRGNKEEISSLNLLENSESASSAVFFSVMLKNKTEAKKMLEFLLSRGIDINGRTGVMGQETPLMSVVASGDINAVNLLLANGANTELTDDTGKNALQIAKKWQNNSPHKEDYSKIIKLLEEHKGRKKP
jgi:hypothetical protein